MSFGDDLPTTQVVVLLLLAAVAVFAVAARWLRVAYPIVLVIAGSVVSFIPHVPRIRLEPDVVFLLLLPPLLYASAQVTSWRELRHNAAAVAMLAVGLVVFTILGVALFAEHFIAALDFKSGLVLGAVVAATDPIAATAIARSLGLPRRLVDILEAESLLNDATGLLALELGMQMLRSGETPTAGGAALRLLYLVIVGSGIGVLLGWLASRLTRLIDDGPIELIISLLVPYVAYLAGEAVHASGVFAVIACGLYVARQNAGNHSPQVRLQVNGVWEALTFLLNGIVFLLIGLQMPFVLAAIDGTYRHATLVGYGLVFAATLIALRLVWTYPAAWLAYQFNRRVLGFDEARPTARGIFVVGWTGMRGVLALAAALSLPEMLGPGRPFAARDLIVFLSFAVIVVTLVLQGLTLPPLIRALELGRPGEGRDEELRARRATLESALSFLEKNPPDAADSTYSELHGDLVHRYRHRLSAVHTQAQDGPEHPSFETETYLRLRDLATRVIQEERRALVAMRDGDEISDDTMRTVERELDLTEARVQGPRG